MTLQDSDSDLAGRLGASLTPPVRHAPRVHLPRDEQSSGFFDLDALYTAYPVQAPPAPLPVMVPRRPRTRPLVVEQPVVELRRARRAQPIGWFAVFVTWLATTTLAGLVATHVPGHVRLRPRTAPPSSGVIVPATIAGSVTVASATSVTASVPAAATPSSAAAISVDELPVAGASLRPAHAVEAPRIKHTVTHPSRVAAPAPVPAAPTEALHAPAPSPPPVARPAPVSTANMSLDELIRHEVAAEQKRVHPTAPAP
jgi:hypothetical protein